MSSRDTGAPHKSSSAILRIGDAMARLSKSQDSTFLELFRHASLMTEIWKPEGVDTQEPHSQDELYFVVRGEGEFVHGTERGHVAAGDLLFVPAQVPHRFEHFTTDFVVWVVFYGPQGGEKT